ncbi:MAG TPA: ribosomal L7Ae/L30e/S12e/Gadd45 family protein [Clostridiales bacterium]|nr:ribosomal L7Ae/L30e/S12e/Gadd45 family protein [Clostridiales bacterium]
MLELLKNSKKTVGSKQSLKAIQGDQVKMCIIARDADEKVIRSIKEPCEKKSIEITYADDMKKLGKACNIDVGASVVCILK